MNGANLALGFTALVAIAGASRRGSAAPIQTRAGSWSDVEAVIAKANARHEGSSRDAWAALPRGVQRLQWTFELVPLDSLSLDRPASLMDVRRYVKRMKAGEVPPPIVLVVDRGGRFGVVDGSHRATAAKQAGQTHLWAWVGRDAKGATP